MLDILLTQHSGIIGPVAKLLGYIINWVYMLMDRVFDVQNVGLCIILFTLVIYLCLLPLTIKQQKFSKLSQKAQPEIQAIQKKYKDKKDQASMMAMNEETQLVYQKYGISPSGSCVQLIIQMPILFALYRVINNVPAYVKDLKAIFTDAVSGIMGTEGYADTITNFMNEIGLKTVKFTPTGTEEEVANSIIDVLYKVPSNAWANLEDKFAGISDVLVSLEEQLAHANNFLGINIVNTPMNIIKEGWSAGQYLLVIGALLVPILSAVTQLLNIKLMPTSTNNNTNNDSSNAMASSMKTMNYMMPIMSFVMVFSLPVGMGIYWIAGAVIRSIQQVVINKCMEKVDLDELIKKNQEKAKKKRAKKGIPEGQISSVARMNTRSMAEKANITGNTTNNTETKKSAQNIEYSKNAKPGSLAAKANMVKEFNERNNK